MLLSAQIQEAMEWRKWALLIPYLQFPVKWRVKAIPPYLGAVVRYNILLPDDTFVSVYLDCYDIIGHYGEPYWEVYPVNGDIARCLMNDTVTLMELIASGGDDETQKEKQDGTN